MAAKKAAKKENKQGTRAATEAQTSISLDAGILQGGKKAAKGENRSFSNWVEELIKEKLGLR